MQDLDSTYWLIVSGLLFVVLIITYLLLKQKIALAKEKINNLQKERTIIETALEKEKRQGQQVAEQRNELQSQLAGMQKETAFLQQQLTNQQQNEERLHQQFENLANKIIDEKGKRFSKQNEQQLQLILNPLKDKIQAFEKKVEESNHQQIKRHTSLKEQLNQLKELNTTISEEANNLTKALKGQTKTQGNWGELILETVLEKSGLEKNREYFVQENFTTKEGKRVQPDVIIHLPDDKRMIVDSKVSLTAYEQFVNTTSETERESFLKQHIQSVQRHIQQLSAKQYHQIYEMDSPDFVLMFIPIETAFSIVIQQDASLYQKAFDKNIVIVTPSTLLATLKTIDSLWQNEKQRKNTIEIATQAGLMYDKFVGFVDDLENIGNRLRKTNDSYEEAIKKLAKGKGNLVSKAEKLKKLGAKASKNLKNTSLNN